MDAIFFRQLHLPYGKYNLKSAPVLTLNNCQILDRIEKVYSQEKPDVVFVQEIPIVSWLLHWLRPRCISRSAMLKPDCAAMTAECRKS
jgi:hypothetical protein